MTLPKKLFTTLDLPVLTALLNEAGLKLVDIGGRGAAFDPLITLARFAEYYVCEPDSAEAERLTASLPRDATWRRLTVFDTAIASRPGVAGLHITAAPGMSSLLEPDPVVAGRFCLAPKFDVVSVVEVTTMTLDDAAARYGFEDAAFVKLDTQGTELDILQSGPRLVAGPLLGVYAELSFHPFYKGQPVFADVDSHLRQQGFTLCSLHRTMLRRAGYQPPRYSRRIVTWAHCLYLREPASLVAGASADPHALPRLLGLAAAFQHFDLAFEIAVLIGQVGLLAAAEAACLAQEIERASDLSLRYLLRKKDERDEDAAAGPAESLTAPSARDKTQRE